MKDLLTKANASLQESESRFRRLVQHAPVAITIYSGPDLIIEEANDAMLRLLGREADILGQPLLKARPELADHPYLDVIREVFESGTEHIGRAVKGPVLVNNQVVDRFFDVTYKPVKDDSGKVSGLIVVASDVTEQQLARTRELALDEELASINEELYASNVKLLSSQESLQELNATLKRKNEELSILAKQLAYVSNSIPQQVWTATPDGLLDFVNEQTIRYFGKTESEIIGENWVKLVYPADLENATKAWTHSLSTGEPYQTEFRLLSKKGTYEWHLARATAYKEDGGIIKWFGTNTNIDGHKQLEQHKSDFISIASHELKTPLTSLKASIQLLNRLKDQPDNPVLAKMIEQCNRGILKVSTLVNDLLSVSRMNEGQMHLKKTRFAVGNLLKSACEPILAENNCTIQISGDLEIELQADDHLIEQVVVNLVNNAIKYAPESEMIKLHVAAGDNMVKISVSDYGPGIPEEKLPYLFDRYYRADHSGQQYSGLGLGLYICAEIINRHSGKIGIDSELGKGSTFWFTLPYQSL